MCRARHVSSAVSFSSSTSPALPRRMPLACSAVVAGSAGSVKGRGAGRLGMKQTESGSFLRVILPAILASASHVERKCIVTNARGSAASNRLAAGAPHSDLSKRVTGAAIGAGLIEMNISACSLSLVVILSRPLSSWCLSRL